MLKLAVEFNCYSRLVWISTALDFIWKCLFPARDITPLLRVFLSLSLSCWIHILGSRHEFSPEKASTKSGRNDGLNSHVYKWCKRRRTKNAKMRIFSLLHRISKLYFFYVRIKSYLVPTQCLYSCTLCTICTLQIAIHSSAITKSLFSLSLYYYSPYRCFPYFKDRKYEHVKLIKPQLHYWRISVRKRRLSISI